MLPFALVLSAAAAAAAMTARERAELRSESRDMFYHAYNAYLEKAFPADELMPLSCRGRVRGKEPSRGDIDDVLGNFSLTLIDSMDTLVILGDLDEFERAVRLVINGVSFDHDITVSVFETNIRIVGGLLSAHVLAEFVKERYDNLGWYQGEMLNMAVDIGYRLLPAFNSSTGLPHPRVNLRHGIKAGKIPKVGETCTACAGTMILEFAALSRLSGEPVFEEKASRAMDVLWSARHRQSNLVGNVVNIHSGDWVRRDSGVGAGIDSYYEYVAKAYVLLGDDKYLQRWETHYGAIMKYLGGAAAAGGGGPLLQDVHMHRPQTASRNFHDSLAAFWPGLQVLMGDLEPAVRSHEVHYQVMKRHHFIPEAFTADYQVHWGQAFLRPEFVESTYFLYRATHDPHYLEVGRDALRSIQRHARVTCGYATIKDVRTLQKEDRMDSFVLSETFKYLYLLFAEESELLLDVNDFVFTTEAHLLPLTLARLSNHTAVPLKEGQAEWWDEDVDNARSCPSTHFLFPSHHASTASASGGARTAADFARALRGPLANHVADKCPVGSAAGPPKKRKLLAADFQQGNDEHVKLLAAMGINLVSLPDGRVQLLHSFANAATPDDAGEGLLFMQEMIELSKQQQSGEQPLPETPPKVVSFPGGDGEVSLFAGPAQFGRQVQGGFQLSGQLVLADPATACKDITNGNKFKGRIVLVERGDCMFIEKARVIESYGAIGGVVMDNVDGSSAHLSSIFSMSGDGNDDVNIPMLFLFKEDAKRLLRAFSTDIDLEVSFGEAEGSESVEDGDEAGSDSMFDFAAPVKSFLERSRRRMQSYFAGGQKERLDARDEDEKEDPVDTLNVRELSDGSVLATREEEVTDGDGQTRTQRVVEALREMDDGSISVRTLTDEEVQELIARQPGSEQEEERERVSGMDKLTVQEELSGQDVDEEEDELDSVVLPEVINLSENKADSVIDLDRYANVWSALNPERLSSDPALEALSRLTTAETVKLVVQLMWENRDLQLEPAVRMAGVVAGELGRERALRRVDGDAVGAFVDAAVDAVRPTLTAQQFRLEFGRDQAALLRKVGGGDVQRRRQLVVYPVLFDAIAVVKRAGPTTATRDEL